jgi:hypothetical protein
MRVFLRVDLWILGSVLIILVPLLAVAAQALIRRRWPVIVAGEHNEVAGFLIAVVGVMYAVTVAFCVIATWESFENAKVDVESEASELRVVLRETDGLPPAVRSPMHDLVIAYAHDVAVVEWPAMDGGRRSDHAFTLLNEMFSTLARAPATSVTEQVFMTSALDRQDKVSEYRISRLDAAREGIPRVLWMAIIIGGMLTIGFALMFGTSNQRLHYLMIWGFSAVVTLQIFVILVLNYPFSGSYKVSPGAFEELVADFR